VPGKKFTSTELKVMTCLWDHGRASIRAILDSYPSTRRPAYTTVQTLVYRLEEKGAVRRIDRSGGAHIFEAVVSRQSVGSKLIDELYELFGGQAQPLMSHLIDSGKLTHEDFEAAKQRMAGKKKAQRKD
jgi:predicted transcriptional regulator